MDVDLLKPGSVPISPDTVLGFEFLLNRDLLLQHLEKPNPDPSPIDLITKFYDAITTTLRNRMEPETMETVTTEGSTELKIKHPKKNVAMKILSLKVAAYLNWNLTQIRTLPYKTQINLLQDLLYYSGEGKTAFEISNIKLTDAQMATPQYLFALLLLYRWLLYSCMQRVTSNWQPRYAINDISLADETIICGSENINKTIGFLLDALNWEEVPLMLTFDCFKTPTEENDSIDFEWSKGKVVSREEFRAQICFDLGMFFFYREDYETAKQNFFHCQQFNSAIKERNGFATFNDYTLGVYIQACDPTVDIHTKSLLEQLNNSIVNQFTGITNVLQQDNVRREIPLSHRVNLELDIQGALSSGAFTVARDLLWKVKALNYVRCILDQNFLVEYSLSVSKNVDAFIWAIQVNWNQHSSENQQIIKQYLMELMLKQEVLDLNERLKTNALVIFQQFELEFMTKRQHVVADFPEGLFRPETGFMDRTRKRNPVMELKQLTKQLISSYDWKEIKDLLTKIMIMNLDTSVWEMNPNWQLPIPLQSVIKSLPRGMLHELSFLLLAKSKEQLLNKNWNLALELLIVLDKELENASCNVSKLSKMVNWEVLLVQITQLLEEWPRSSVDKTALANACEACLQTGDSVLPRTEIVESCAIYLLNLGRWEFLIGYEKRWTLFEIMSGTALACHELVKHKGSKKFSKDLWDLVLPVFAPNGQTSKRGSGGYHHDSATANLKMNLVLLFSKLKDSRCLTVVIALLTKFYNIFRDETNMELQVDYMGLWPATVSNASSYNLNAVSELLSEVLTLGLKQYPTNVPWLRLMGDINYANGVYKTSISFYLKSLIICYDYFNIPLRYDDHVFRRLIKCCQALGCYTQAASLCQFLEDPDYSLAFRILGEQKACNDSVDAYYLCFWDTNILEYLIHIHNRRGEFQRRKGAIQVMGMLELNSNNNDEIQREASNLRKSIFLRALCKQFVF